MDAIEFIKERQRMCRSFKNSCKECPLSGKPCGSLNGVDAERFVGAIEEWSAAHPRKTRHSVFMEQWPDVWLDGNRVISVSPCTLSKEYRDMNCDLRDCAECRKEFWLKEVE